MGVFADRLAVQSWCFRGYKDNAKAAQAVKACGMSRLEISSAHVDFNKPETFDTVVDTYRQAGVQIVSIGAVGFRQQGNERNYFELARKADLKFLAVDFDLNTTPDCYRTAEKLASEYGVKLGIHNHGGKHWLGSSAMLQYVLKHTNESIGLCIDTAWAMHSHEDPLAMVERFASRVYGVHIKDFVFDRAGRHQDVVVGTGNLDLRKLADALAKIGFGGYPVLEYEGDVDNPDPAIKQCVEAIRKAM
jgi:sugar phosphate isomerase/epimerase